MKTIKYNYKGIWATIPELAKLTGRNKETIRTRLKRGMTIEEAIESESRKSNKGIQEPGPCDAWGCDCFHCRLPDCIDNRPCRRNEVYLVPETEGIREAYETKEQKVFRKRKRK